MIASSGRLANSAIFFGCRVDQRLSERHDEHVGLDTDPRSSFTECCVGLVFSSPAWLMYGTSVRWMNMKSSRPDVDRELADRLEKRQRLDVADGAADSVMTTSASLVSAQPDALLDLVGDVGNDLDGRAEIVAAAFPADHA